MVIGKPDLQVKIRGLVLKNPVLTASGTFGYGRELASLVDPVRLGAVIVKGISLQPRAGNPPPRIFETPCGMLNAIGLENIGVEKFINEKLPFLRENGACVIVNILGDSVEEYGQLAEILDNVPGIHAVEVNISCPNVKQGGVAFGIDPEAARRVTAEVRKKCSLPVIIKLSPNVTDITSIARAAEDGGADAVSLINTIQGMAIDIQTRRPRLANVIGGLSGPAIRPVAVRMVWQTAKAVSIPVIGIGGITTPEDALEFLIAGASAVQIGTGNFINPKATIQVLEGIEKYLLLHNINSIHDLTGSLND